MFVALTTSRIRIQTWPSIGRVFVTAGSCVTVQHSRFTDRRYSPVIFPALVLLLGVLGSTSCGSSATTSTAPSPLVRCSLTLTSTDQMVPAAGGTGTVAIAATRECTWAASAESAWLSVRSGQSGQGNGMVEFAAARNPDPASRRGALVVNGQRAEITQEAGTCDITLATSSASFTPDGGSGRVEGHAPPAPCARGRRYRAIRGYRFAPAPMAGAVAA